MHKLVAAVGLFRAPIICVSIYAVALLLPGQSRQVFRAILEAQGTDFAIEIARTATFTLALAIVVLTVCATLMKHVADSRRQAVDAHFVLLEVLAIGLAVTPILVVWLLSIDFTTVSVVGSETVVLPARFMDIRVNYLLYGATFLVTAAALGVLVWLDDLRSAIVSAFARLPFHSGLGLLAGASLVGAIVVALSFAFVQAPLLAALILGPFGLAGLFFGIIIVASSLMTAVYDRYGLPILWALAIAAVLFSYMGWSDNHEIRSLAEQPAKSQTLQAEFVKWLEARPDRAHYAGRPYPVYVVAAEGGGLYAAAHAASVLARLQDECPGFARHVFAISGVSGGSLGAAVFTSLLDALPPGDGKGCERAGQTQPLLPLVKRYFESDFLSPLLAYALFPDFLQRFLPVRIPQFDRARGLETAFEAAWQKALSQPESPVRSTAFTASFRSLWSASASKPALLLNATSVQYGGRVVISPFVLQDGTGFSDIDVDLLNTGDAIALSTAVGVSARFPVITPPAWRAKGTRRQFVDGGYYENSGLATAVHLIDAIVRWSAPLPQAPGTPQESAKDGAQSACAATNTVAIGNMTVCLKLIVIRAPPDRANTRARGELTAPLFAAYKALDGLERASGRLAMTSYCGGKMCGRGPHAENPHIYFRVLAAKLPLGWYFSKSSIDSVLRAPPSETECVQQGDRTAAATENACLIVRVRKDLG